MRVDFTPTVIEARIYDRGSYKERSAYRGSFVMHVVGETATITLLTGECSDCAWTPAVNRKMTEYVRRLGVKLLTYEVKGKRVERRLSD